MSADPENMTWILEERVGEVLLLTLNRPEKANAYHQPMLNALSSILTAFEHDESLKVVIFTGRGRAFCAGADLNELKARSAEDGLNLLSGQLFDRLAALRKPSIAAINGPAVGGGLELALACDLRVGCAEGWMALPELQHGVIPAAGGIRRLTRLLGAARARAVILAGKHLDAGTAYTTGLLCELVSREALLNSALNLAQRLASLDSVALRLARMAIDAEAEVDARIGLERVAQALLYSRRKPTE